MDTEHISNSNEFLTILIKKGILVETDVFERIKEMFEKNNTIACLVAKSICNDCIGEINHKLINEKISFFEKKNNIDKKGKIIIKKTFKKTRKDYDAQVNIRKIKENTGKKDISLFCDYFVSRYDKIKKILMQHLDLTNLVSIGNIKSARGYSDISIIAIVKDVIEAKTGTIIIDAEDKSGTIRVFAKDPDLCKNIVTDEVIGITGSSFAGGIIAKKIIFPEIPFPVNVNKIKEPLKAVFISDIHIGSKEYLKSIEEKFLKWIEKDKQTEAVKYLFISGDNVDGVGIYPSQKEDLQIKDIYDQYSEFENFIEKIPEEIEIMICPGNHDAVMQFEPQMALDEVYVPNLMNYSNVHLVKNPDYVYLHDNDGSNGLKVLMYHGYSFTSIIDAIPELRKKGLSHPEHVMTEVLKKRHLAPIYGSSIISPAKEDNLVIEEIPDIFQTGDLHSHCLKSYKGITLISSSTFQGQTSFMNKVGHIANPGKVSIVDLHTREIFVKNFM